MEGGNCSVEECKIATPKTSSSQDIPAVESDSLNKTGVVHDQAGPLRAVKSGSKQRVLNPPEEDNGSGHTFEFRFATGCRQGASGAREGP